MLGALTETPAAFASRFDSTLSPMATMAEAAGPTKVAPASATAWVANFGARNHIPNRGNNVPNGGGAISRKSGILSPK